MLVLFLLTINPGALPAEMGHSGPAGPWDLVIANFPYQDLLGGYPGNESPIRRESQCKDGILHVHAVFGK
jgi:hypothetical protein